MRRSKKAEITRTTITIDGQEIPVKLVRERRNSVRAAMGKREVIMRFPHHLTQAEFEQHYRRLTDWLRQQYAKKDGLFDRYQAADYQTGDVLRVGSEQYTLRLMEADRKTSAGQLKDGVLHLKLSAGMTDTQRSQAIRTLLSRVIAQDQLPRITSRVLALNDAHFQQPIRSVNLKYNTSNWGSCSNTGNINLSTRLLFAPPEVIDYVIVHELAHLIEQNHSQRFWDQVARAMPDYEQHEQWLKEFGHQCDF